MKYLLIILLLTSCRTTKYVDKISYRMDSTAIRKVDSLIEIKREDSLNYSKVIELLSENNVVFRDTGSTRIEYYPDGSIRLAEGIKSLNSRFDKMQSETSYWKTKFDSISQIKRKDSIQVKKDYQKVEVKKKVSVIPWWIWLIALAALVIGWKLNKIKIPFL